MPAYVGRAQSQCLTRVGSTPAGPAQPCPGDTSSHEPTRSRSLCRSPSTSSSFSSSRDSRTLSVSTICSSCRSLSFSPTFRCSSAWGTPGAQQPPCHPRPHAHSTTPRQGPQPALALPQGSSPLAPGPTDRTALSPQGGRGGPKKLHAWPKASQPARLM